MTERINVVNTIKTDVNPKNRRELLNANRAKLIERAEAAEKVANRNKPAFKSLYDKIESLEAENVALRKQIEELEASKPRKPKGKTDEET